MLSMRARAVSILLLLALDSMVVRAQQRFVLVANQANPRSALRKDEVSKIFLKKLSKWPDGERVMPVDQSESTPVRRAFSDAIHGLDVPGVTSYWQEIVFAGRGEPPPERPSDEQVIAFVRANRNAVGYVSNGAVTEGVKIIVVTP